MNNNEERNVVEYNNTKYSKYLELILNSNSCQEIEQKLYDEKIIPSKLTDFIERYRLRFKENKEQIEKLNDFYIKYNNFSKEKAQESRKLFHIEKVKNRESNIAYINALKTIQEFIESNLTIYQYCREKECGLRTIDNQLNTIKRYSIDDYNLYSEMINKIETKHSKENIVKLLQMQQMISNGIEENGHIRDFDIIDYYLMTNMRPNDFYNSCKKTLEKEYLVIDIKIYLSMHSKDHENALSIDKAINSEVGYIKNNIGYFVTKEEKKDIIEKLITNNIPFQDATYRAAVKRYIEYKNKQYIK